jgi:Ni,Fe-hydrogenase maturation factor
MSKGRKLVISCGNSLRQDDGAGLLLAAGLAGYWQAHGLLADHIQVQQLLPELALAIAKPAVAEVWFVDCRVAQNESDRGLALHPVLTGTPSPALGHQLAPATLLWYARSLFDERPPAEQPVGWQLTIPGFAFGHGETLSSTCQTILDDALQQFQNGCGPFALTGWEERHRA